MLFKRDWIAMYSLKERIFRVCLPTHCQVQTEHSRKFRPWRWHCSAVLGVCFNAGLTVPVKTVQHSCRAAKHRTMFFEQPPLIMSLCVVCRFQWGKLYAYPHPQNLHLDLRAALLSLGQTRRLSLRLHFCDSSVRHSKNCKKKKWKRPNLQRQSRATLRGEAGPVKQLALRSSRISAMHFTQKAHSSLCCVHGTARFPTHLLFILTLALKKLNNAPTRHIHSLNVAIIAKKNKFFDPLQFREQQLASVSQEVNTGRNTSQDAENKCRSQSTTCVPSSRGRPRSLPQNRGRRESWITSFQSTCILTSAWRYRARGLTKSHILQRTSTGAVSSVSALPATIASASNCFPGAKVPIVPYVSVHAQKTNYRPCDWVTFRYVQKYRSGMSLHLQDQHTSRPIAFAPPTVARYINSATVKERAGSASESFESWSAACDDF